MTETGGARQKYIRIAESLFAGCAKKRIRHRALGIGNGNINDNSKGDVCNTSPLLLSFMLSTYKSAIFQVAYLIHIAPEWPHSHFYEISILQLCCKHYNC